MLKHPAALVVSLAQLTLLLVSFSLRLIRKRCVGKVAFHPLFEFGLE